MKFLVVGMVFLGLVACDNLKDIQGEETEVHEPIPVVGSENPPATVAPPPPVSPQTAGNDLCDGLVTDKKPHPMTALAKPNNGQTVTDPEFRTRIRRITGVSSSEGNNAVIRPMYSTMPAWNADESYLILWHRGQSSHELYNGTTYQFIRSMPLESPTDIEQVLWDPLNPDTVWYPSSYDAQPRFMKYSVSANTNSVYRDFGKDDHGAALCPVDWGKLLTTGSDPFWMSFGMNGQKIIGLKCGTTMLTYDIAVNKIIGKSTTIDGLAPAVTPSGTMAGKGSQVYDTSLNPLRKLLTSGYEHASIGYSPVTQHDTYNTVIFDPVPGNLDVGTLVTFDMATGMWKVIVGCPGGSCTDGWPYTPSGTHISAIAYKNPGWVGVSIVGYKADGQDVLDNEILLSQPDTMTVCRVGHHRSKAGKGPWGYWAEPHVNISPTGTRLLFASDWGGGNSVDSYVVELPSYIFWLSSGS